VELHWSAPVWAWTLLLAAAVAAWVWTWRIYRVSAPPVGNRLRRFLSVLRGLVFLLLLVAAARPVVSRLVQQQRPAEVAIVVEDSASMMIADAAGQSRWLAALGIAVQVDSMLTASGVEQAPRVTFLRGNGRAAPQELDPHRSPSPPTAVGTDLPRLLSGIAERFTGRPLRAILLLSDGNESSAGVAGSPGSPTVLNDGLSGALQTLIVGVGDPIGPADRLLTDLRYPDMAYVGDEVVVDLSVAHRFAPQATGQAITVRLLTGGQVVADTSLAPVGDVTRLTVNFRPEEPGLHLYRLEVSPLVNERFLANNQVTLAINVRKERSRLLLLADRPGWDVRFLALAADREQRLRLEVVYPGPEGPLLADSLTTWRVPATRDDWLHWDGVILTGWSNRLGRIDFGELAAAVQAGLGLWVLPGSRPPGPRAVGRATMRDLPPALAMMLPFAAAEWRWRRGDWFLQVEDGAEGHPVLEGVNVAPSGSAALGLADLPPLAQVIPVSVVGEGQTLLNAVLGGDAVTTTPLLVMAPVGDGRVVWFGGRRLWELAFWERPAARSAGGDQPARRLLRNLLVWTATGQEEAGLAMIGRRRVYQEGEGIRLEAQWRDMRGDAIVGRPLNLRLRADDEAAGFGTREFAMTPQPGRPGTVAVDLPPLPPGRYSVRPQSAGGAEVVGTEESLVVTESSLEQVQVRQDARRLRQLAESLGGSYHATANARLSADLERALAQLVLTGDTLAIRHRWDFWAGWPLLGLAATLLGCEWLLRRRHGLL